MFDYMLSWEFWKIILSSLGGAVTALAILIFLSKTWISERIKRDVEDTYNAKSQQRQFEFNHALEDHKNSLSKELEGWKAGYQKVLAENHIRFSRLHSEQADTIKTIYSLLVRMERKLNVLVNPLQFVPKDSEERKKYFNKQRSDYVDAFVTCHDDFEEKRVYFSKQICDQIDQMLDTAHRVYIDFTAYDGMHTDYDPQSRGEQRKLQFEAYENMKKNFPGLREKLENEFRAAMGMIDMAAPNTSASKEQK